MSGTALIILIAANLPVYWVIGWAIFREWDEFVECLRFWITPDIISLFRGEAIDDFWAEMRLGFWVACCAAAVYGEYYLIARFFLHQTGG